VRHHFGAEHVERAAELGAVDAVVRLVGVLGPLVPEEVGTTRERKGRDDEYEQAQDAQDRSVQRISPVYLSFVRAIMALSLFRALRMRTSP
jgi:hypothetical protein